VVGEPVEVEPVAGEGVKLFHINSHAVGYLYLEGVSTKFSDVPWQKGFKVQTIGHEEHLSKSERT